MSLDAVLYTLDNLSITLDDVKFIGRSIFDFILYFGAAIIGARSANRWQTIRHDRAVTNERIQNITGYIITLKAQTYSLLSVAASIATPIADNKHPERKFTYPALRLFDLSKITFIFISDDDMFENIEVFTDYYTTTFALIDLYNEACKNEDDGIKGQRHEQRKHIQGILSTILKSIETSRKIHEELLEHLKNDYNTEIKHTIKYPDKAERVIKNALAIVNPKKYAGDQPKD